MLLSTIFEIYRGSHKEHSVYQLLAHGWWFSPATPASSTTKTGCHHIAESGVKTPKIKSNVIVFLQILRFPPLTATVYLKYCGK
jgi:hypothetical protein